MPVSILLESVWRGVLASGIWEFGVTELSFLVFVTGEVWIPVETLEMEFVCMFVQMFVISDNGGMLDEVRSGGTGKASNPDNLVDIVAALEGVESTDSRVVVVMIGGFFWGELPWNQIYPKCILI